MRFALLIVSVVGDLVVIYFFLRLAVGRSVTATIAEGFLYITGYRRRFSNRKSYEKYFAARSKANEAPYVLPSSSKIRAPLSKETFGEVPVYIFNKGKGEIRAFYLHGGAFINRPQKMHWHFFDRLAKKTGCEIVIPLYPLLPKAEGASVFAEIRELYLELTADGKETVLMGDSSGGGLAAAIAASGIPTPSQLILISPWVDVSMRNTALTEYDRDPLCALYGLKRLGKAWAEKCGVDDPRVSPIGGALSTLQNVTVFVGERELLYPDIMRFCAAVPNCETVVGKGLHHVYPLYPIPEAKRAMNTIVEKF